MILKPNDARLCGCWIHRPEVKEPEPVPLKSVHVEALLSDMIAAVTVAQEYTNSEPTEVTVEYKFPILEGVAVRDFVATVNGQRLRGKVMAKEEAKDVFDNAVSSGDGAFLGSHGPEGDMFVVKLGNLPAGATAKIELTWVAEVDSEGPNALRWTLPMVLMPRYGAPPSPPAVTTPAIRTAALEKAAAASSSTTKAPPPFTFRLAVSSSRPLGTVASPSHEAAVKVTQNSETSVVVESAEPIPNAKDLVVSLQLLGAPEPFVRVETDAAGRPTAAMVSFFPGDAAEAEEDAVKNEVVFLMDRSGSMSGSPIKSAVDALQMFLRSLTPGTTFNIVSFGSRHVKLWKTAMPYSDKTLKEATEHAASMKADLGGTVLLTPLNEIFRETLDPKRMRQVIVLTDGAVNNTSTVVDACAQAAEGGTRVFTLGVGRGVSTQLVRGMARAGRGVAEFAGPGEEIGPKVIRQAAIALSPSYDEVSAVWHRTATSAAETWTTSVLSKAAFDVAKNGPVRTPTGTPAVFRESRTTLYWLWTPAGGESPDAAPPAKVVFNARHSKGWSAPVSFEVAIDPAVHVLPAGASTTIAKLAARAMLADLEQKDMKERGVAMSMAHNVGSQFTSYVAVEERDSPSTEGAKLRIIPTATVRDGAIPSRGGAWGSRGGGGANRVMMARGPPMAISRASARSGAPETKSKSKKKGAAGGFSLGFGGMLKGVFAKANASQAPVQERVAAAAAAPSRPRARVRKMAAAPQSDRSSSMAAVSMDSSDDCDEGEAEMLSGAPLGAPIPPPAPAPAAAAAAPGAAPSAPPPPAGPDHRKVAMEQGATGAWNSVPASVAGVLGGAAAIAAACPGGAPSGEAARAWATAVVIAWAELKQKDNLSEMALILAKAKKWLRKVDGGAHAGLLDAALAFVGKV